VIEQCISGEIMTDSKFRNKNYNVLCSSWISFAIAFFFFYIIGDFIMGWWHNQIWVWVILGFFLLSSIGTTIRFFVYKNPQVSINVDERYYNSNKVEVNSNLEKGFTFSSYPEDLNRNSNLQGKFCKFCGTKIYETDSFCSNCGANIEKD